MTICLLVSARLSQVGILSKRFHGSSLFGASYDADPSYVQCAVRRFKYLQKYGYFPLERCIKH